MAAVPRRPPRPLPSREPTVSERASEGDKQAIEQERERLKREFLKREKKRQSRRK